MKNLYLSFCLCLTTHLVSAQDYLWTLDASAGAGTSFLVFFDDFSAAYNDYFKEELKSDLGQMKWGTGYSIGTTALINALYTDFSFDTRHTGTSASFIDNAQGDRHYKAKHRMGTIALGYFVADDDYIFTVGGYFGFNRVNVDSYRKYPSGEKSFGAENSTNGKFIGQSFVMGLKTNFNSVLTDRLLFSVGLNLGFTMPGSDLREVSSNYGLHVPGTGYDKGIPSMTRTGMLLIGFKYAIINDL